MMFELKCGFAQRAMTPVPEHVYLDGYGFRLTPAEGVHDPLYVKACAIECGEKKFALLSFDICGMSAAVYDYVSGHIEDLTGLERSQLALTCTHTHAAPACGVLAGLPIQWDWLAFAAEMASEAVNEAYSTTQAGQFSFSIVGDLEHVYNRRGRAPLDRRIRCGVFAGEDGKIRGILASAACHAVVNKTMNISADFISVLTQEAEQRYPGVPAIFISGRGSDTNPHNPDGLPMETLLATLGHDLADQVLNYADAVSGQTMKAVALEILSDYRFTNVPMKPFTPADVCRQEIKKLTEAFKNEKEAAAMHFILRELDYQRDVLKKIKKGETPDLTVPLQILVIKNTAVFVMLPFEVLTLTGHAIEDMLCARGFAPENIFVCGNSNSVNGYLAPYAEFEHGGYEVAGAAHWYGLAECSVQSEQAVLNAIDDMLNALCPEANKTV